MYDARSLIHRLPVGRVNGSNVNPACHPSGRDYIITSLGDKTRIQDEAGMLPQHADGSIPL